MHLRVRKLAPSLISAHKKNKKTNKEREGIKSVCDLLKIEKKHQTVILVTMGLSVGIWHPELCTGVACDCDHVCSSPNN